jgi:hypothetical protein
MDRIGIGLLKALRAGSNIVFEEKYSPIDVVASKTEHLVVCEEGEDLAQIIAANYAYSLRAGLCLIPKVGDQQADDLLEQFYSLYDDTQHSPTHKLERLKEQLTALCGPLPVPPSGSITFIASLPLGFAMPDFPSTHIFNYPDLGAAMVNGFSGEQSERPGIGLAVLVDPQTTEANEIAAAEKLLFQRGAMVRTYQGPAANVRDIAEMIELLPYDLLVIATHCGDVSGYRWTYEYQDTEGIDRVLVVDVGIGLQRTDDDNMLGVRELIRFVSLDGVDWYDPQKTEKLYVGRAILDFMERAKTGPNQLQPTRRSNISRVIGSAALKMHDHNLLVLPKPLADEGAPIIINNACCSWHGLAKNFAFGNARAYVGTLFPVMAAEAEEVVVKLLDKHFGKPLALALWAAQRGVYGSGVRRPYVAMGIYPQRLRAKRHDVIRRIGERLSRSLAGLKRNLEKVDPNDGPRVKLIEEAIAYYERELSHFRDLARR